MVENASRQENLFAQAIFSELVSLFVETTKLRYSREREKERERNDIIQPVEVDRAEEMR